MNKLLILALLGFALVAFTAGEEENNESSLEAFSAEVDQVREAREADPKRKAKKGKKKKKSKKNLKKKSRKNKQRNGKGKKKKSKGKKRNGKGKKKKSKGKKRKGKGNKKKGKKRNKNKKNKSSKKVKSSGRATTCNSDSTCLENIAKYLNQVNNKYKNFIRQESRITKFNKLTDNKNKKNGDFKTIGSQIKEAGGGNSSNFKCGGKAGGKGAEALKGVFKTLGDCQAGIKKACKTDGPTYNATYVSDCSKTMKSFNDAVTKCTAMTDATKVCTCWKADSLSTLSAAAAKCDISSINTKIAKFKASCTSAFAKCRQEEDKASTIIKACGDKSYTDNQLKSLNAATANKAALTTLKATIATKSAKQVRIVRALSCADFITGITKLLKMIEQVLFSKEIETQATSLNSNAPASCTTSEKATLKTQSTSIETSISNYETIITDIQSDLTTLTGSTATSSQITGAGTTTAATTTTAKSSGRKVMKNLFVV